MAARMVVRVRFFASLREDVGRDGVDLALADATLDGVRGALAELLDAAARRSLAAPGVRVAVNQAIVDGAVALRDGDEVAFLPPITGG